MNPHRLPIGEKGPDFDLPGVDGKRHSLNKFNDYKLLVVIFTCNHCPYVQAYEDRFIAIQQKFSKRALSLIAINSNEIKTHPEDDFPHMVIRSKEKGFNFPYLRDEDQKIAETYGAHYTPEIFLLDEERCLRYTGRIDDSWQDASAVRSHDLSDAIESLLSGQQVKTTETHAIGCTIKWASP